MRKYGVIPRTVIIGIGENANRIEDSLNKYSHEGNVILGHVDKKQRVQKGDEYTKNLVILGYLDDIKQVIYKNNIQRVIISSPEFKYFEILEILENLKGLDITVLIFPGFFEFSLRRLSVREIGGVPLMQVSNIGFFGYNLFLKNMIDYILGIILFIFFVPIYLIVGIMIKLDSRGPVFFGQKRMTKDCKVFYMYKFRTMFIEAEEKLKDLLQYSEVDGPIFKMKNDPRITRVGRFLRRFSIDELPQIINVLKGELSLVGPRPPLPSEVEKYNEWEMKRMNVKQGITGLWQISGRSDLSFEEMSRLDLYYIQNWSIEMDIKIILKTPFAVLFGKGAY
jgi:exopolysaccharide biosynthesis polyprenyl glycosylphosphotransferase